MKQYLVKAKGEWGWVRLWMRSIDLDNIYTQNLSTYPSLERYAYLNEAISLAISSPASWTVTCEGVIARYTILPSPV